MLHSTTKYLEKRHLDKPGAYFSEVNFMSADQYWNKIFDKMDKKDKVKNTNSGKPVPVLKKDPKYYCKNFEKCKNGFCTNYIGDKVMVESCASNCALEYKKGFRSKVKSNSICSDCKII